MCKTYDSLLSGSGSFKISLDIDKIEKIVHNKLWFIPVKKKEFYKDWDQICAVTDQINLCVRQLNNLVSNADYDRQVNEIIMFFTYGYIIVASVDKLFSLLNYTNIQAYVDSNKSISIFNNIGHDAKGNDNRYFKYLRSLVAGHPIETSLDGSYIKKGDKHFSPYIQRAHQTESNVNIRIYSTSKTVSDIIVAKNDLKKYVEFVYNKLDILFNQLQLDYPTT